MLQATDAGCITGSCGTQGRTAHKLKLQEGARNLHKEHSPGGVLHFLRSQALPRCGWVGFQKFSEEALQECA